jgi:hypothetical protein
MYDHDTPRRASFPIGIEDIPSEVLLTFHTSERSFLRRL